MSIPMRPSSKLSAQFVPSDLDVFKGKRIIGFLQRFWVGSLPFMKSYRRFKSADMSLLQERCLTSKEGAYGAIRYLVIRIGKKCPIWFKEVARSLKNSKGVQYDHLTLARSVKDDKEFAKTFRELMIVNDIVLPK